jgi:ABC-type polysaccharide/polyol phosphate export permease
MAAARESVVTAPPGRASFAAVAMIGCLVRHRALVAALLVRQLKARYRGSILGFVWTFLNPLLLMAVYALVFHFYMRIAVPNYAVFLLAGILPWTWFASSLSEGANAIVQGSSLVTKSLFPTEILPTVVVLTNMVNFVLTIPLLVVAAWCHGVAVSPLALLALAPVIAVECAFILGLVLALAALNVHYRDVQHIVTNTLLLWFFLTPIVYPPSQVPESLKMILWLNPLALFTDIYHDLLVTGAWPSAEVVAMLIADSAVSLFLGAKIFDDYRDTFAELV